MVWSEWSDCRRVAGVWLKIRETRLSCYESWGSLWRWQLASKLELLAPVRVGITRNVICSCVLARLSSSLFLYLDQKSWFPPSPGHHVLQGALQVVYGQSVAVSNEMVNLHRLSRHDVILFLLRPCLETKATMANGSHELIFTTRRTLQARFCST